MDQTNREKELIAENDRLKIQISENEREKFAMRTANEFQQEEILKKVD